MIYTTHGKQNLRTIKRNNNKKVMILLIIKNLTSIYSRIDVIISCKIKRVTSKEES